jgi:hypothetical protein
MTDVDVAIMHAEPDAGSGPLTRATAAARLQVADRHRLGFLGAGASRISLNAGRADDRPFGARLREIVADLGDGGLVVLGSGAIPLANAADLREFVAAAAASQPQALANNRYSADIVAVACARAALADLPDLTTDNELPRWLEEVAGVPVDDRRGRRRLGIDIDGPLDLVLLGRRWASHLVDADASPARAAMADVRSVVDDSQAELLIAGRVSAANLRWLEAHTASRTRALIEERGLRTRRSGQRPAASVLGALLERDGPDSFGEHAGRLGDAAVVDTRVLLAHRFGADESGWPVREDRFASDLLLASQVVDPWLRALTRSAVEAAIPILLGGHTLVGPGLTLALDGHR